MKPNVKTDNEIDFIVNRILHIYGGSKCTKIFQHSKCDHRLVRQKFD